MGDQAQIRVLGREEMADRALTPRPEELRFQAGTVSAATLNRNLREFLAGMEQAISGTPSKLGAFRLDSITLSLDVSVTGEIKLFGVGGQAGATGGIALTLTRGDSG